jgi:hypothetical protein
MKTDLPVSAMAGLAAADDTSQRRWRRSCEFALVDPSGWSMAQYPVYGEWRYLLWEPVDRYTGANSNRFHGPFGNVRDAMRLHRQRASHDTE